MKIFMLAFFAFISILQEQQSQYSILSPGAEWSYKTPDGTFQDYIDTETFQYGKKSYFQNVRKFSDGTAEISYYRIENGAVYYLDNKTFKESLEIPANPRILQQWTSSDSRWEYKVVEVNTELKTPTQTFKDCIAIKARSTVDGSVYINYYSKGIGFVASKFDNDLIAYLVKWKIQEKRS